VTKRMALTVRGKQHEWCFTVYGDPSSIGEWQADGLGIVVVENAIPVWIADLGLTRAWCFVQDVFNFKNPWSNE